MNLWSEIAKLPASHQVAIAAEIIKRHNPDLRRLSVACGLKPYSLYRRAVRQEARQ